jgi:O-antigen/teichoic acid export membrane protein
VTSPPAGPGVGSAAPVARVRGAWSATAVVFVGNVVARGLGFLFPLVLARAVPRDDFALVYFYIATGFFVGELVLAGFPTSLTRYLAAPGDATRGAWFVSSIAAGVPLLIASIAAGWLFAGRADADPRLLALIVIGLTIDAYYFGALRGLGRFGLLAGYRIGANLAQIVLLVVLWVLGVATVPLAVAIYALTYVVPIVVIELSDGPVRGILGSSARVARARLGPLTRFAIPALVSGTAYAAIMGLDVYFVRLLAPEDLADYSAARALAMPMSLVPFAIGVVLMPRVAGSDEAARERLLRQALVATAAAAAAAVVGYVLLAPAVVALVYPAGFEGAAAIAPTLAAAMGMVGIYSVLSQWWMGRGRPVTPAVSLVVGAIAAAIAHLVLDPTAGGIGAAWAMTLGASVAIVLLGGITVLERRPSRRERADHVG